MRANSKMRTYPILQSQFAIIYNEFSILLAAGVGPQYHRFIGSSVHRFIGSSVHRFIGSSV
ncbi:hypothetical protein, partial [uncultured Ruegeria sp.]|uniref:hypothetical protein n=1 Tax=uncultured Ruegeria sp. TaxID=259304 RepID=UPI002602CCE5